MMGHRDGGPSISLINAIDAPLAGKSNSDPVFGENLSKIRSHSARGMPGPLSVTSAENSSLASDKSNWIGTARRSPSRYVSTADLISAMSIDPVPFKTSLSVPGYAEIDIVTAGGVLLAMLLADHIDFGS